MTNVISTYWNTEDKSKKGQWSSVHSEPYSGDRGLDEDKDDVPDYVDRYSLHTNTTMLQYHDLRVLRLLALSTR